MPTPTRNSPSLFLWLAALTVGVLSGCAGGPSGDGPRRPASRITLEELETVSQLNAYEAVQRLRPTWLRTRTGAAPAAFINGTEQVGGVQALQSVPVPEISELRFLTARDATTRFGTGYVNGAILVTTRGR